MELTTFMFSQDIFAVFDVSLKCQRACLTIFVVFHRLSSFSLLWSEYFLHTNISQNWLNLNTFYSIQNEQNEENTNQIRKENSKYQLLSEISRKSKEAYRKADRERKKLARESLKYVQPKNTNFNWLKIELFFNFIEKGKETKKVVYNYSQNT